MTTDRIWLELSDSLADNSLVDEALILAFYKGQVVMLETGLGHHFPRARFEREEELEKTVRRALYEQTGGFLQESRLLGLLRIEHQRPHQGDQHIPIYVGIIHHFERPVLEDVGRKTLCSLVEAAGRMDDHYWRNIKSFLFSHAFNLYKQMKHEADRRFKH